MGCAALAGKTEPKPCSGPRRCGSGCAQGFDRSRHLLQVRRIHTGQETCPENAGVVGGRPVHRFLFPCVDRESGVVLSGFGFETEAIAPALLLVGLLSGTVIFWFSPL